MPIIYNGTNVNNIKFVKKDVTSIDIYKMYYNDVLVYDSSTDYFCIENLTNEVNTISFRCGYYDGIDEIIPILEYSFDKNSWIDLNLRSGTTSTVILNANEKIYVRGNNEHFNYASISSIYSTASVKILSDKNIKVSGNILSLVDKECKTSKSAVFVALFANSINLIDASNLKLPIPEGVTGQIYSELFYNCTSLTNAPKLLANTLSYGCYSSMFYGCTSLTTVPNLPATTLAENCYNSMFYGCTSLVNMPLFTSNSILSSSLGKSFRNMFKGCTLLQNKNIFPNLLELKGGDMMTYMFLDCPNVTTLDLRTLEVLGNTGEYRMFSSIKGNGEEFTLLFSNKLREINTPYMFQCGGADASGATYNLYYYFEESDTPEFNPNYIISKGSSKGTNTFNVYTNNSLIKNGALSQADEYTIVNVYHLDGTPWEV